MIKLDLPIVPNFPKEGINFVDITPVFEDPLQFQAVIDALTVMANHAYANKILAMDARGFVLGARLAQTLQLPLVLCRKEGKLPRPGIKASCDLEYGSATYEISQDSIKSGDRVLIVDDLIATGGTLRAACNIVQQADATVARILAMVDLKVFPDTTEKLAKEFNTVVSVIQTV